MNWTLTQLEQAARGRYLLRPFPIAGWVTNCHWAARSPVAAKGEPIVYRQWAKNSPRTPRAWIRQHMRMPTVPTTFIGNYVIEEWSEPHTDRSTHIGLRLYESRHGVVAVNELYAKLLDGLTPVHMRNGSWDLSPIGGVDAKGKLWVWIMPVRI